MIYAKIISDEENGRYKLHFLNRRKRDEEISEWVSFLNDLEADKSFGEKERLISLDLILNYLSENNFTPVSETFFYKA